MRSAFLISASIIALAMTSAFAQDPAAKGPPGSAAPRAEVVELANQAASAMRTGNFAVAIQDYEKLIRLSPSVAEFHANLGLAYYSAGRFREAVAPCRTALKLKPGLTATRYFLVISLAESGQCQQAVPDLEKDYPRVPDPQLKRLMGVNGLRCSMAMNRPDRAVDFARWLTHDFPDDPEALYLSALVYSELSTRASQQLLTSAPGSYQAHQFNAEVLEYQGKIGEAKEEYRKVLTINPSLTGIHYKLGRLLLEGERGPTTLEEAKKEFEEELKLDPANALAEYELGEMARQGRQWNEAIEHFGRASRIDPEFADALVGLGRSLVSAGRPHEAIAPLEKAVKVAPENPVTHYQLSFAYRRVGREEEAKQELALYREVHEKARRTGQAIRVGMQGRLTAPQTDEAPE